MADAGVRIAAAQAPYRRSARIVLGEALVGDDAWCHVLPQEDTRRVTLDALFSIALREAGEGARVALADGDVVGVAVWHASGGYPMTTGRMLRAAPTMALLALRIGPGIAAVTRFGRAVDRAFPTTPVRYLQVLGVRPDWQGRGVGSALLRDGLSAADADNDVVYLETAKSANVAYYERYGFRVLAGSPAPISEGGPVMWRMLRSRTQEVPRHGA